MAQRSHQRVEILRENVESVVRDSLSPISAGRAMTKLRPYFNDIITPTAVKKIPVKTIRCDLHKNSNQPNIDRFRSKNSYNSSLNPISASVPSLLFELKQTLASNSPSKLDSITNSNSHIEKSTVQVNNFQHNDKNVSEIDEIIYEMNNIHRKKMYDSGALINILKIERTSRKPDFSGFWKWKDDLLKTQSISSYPESVDSKLTKLSKVEDEVRAYLGQTKKNKNHDFRRRQLAKISRMKQVYFSNINYQDPMSDCDSDDGTVPSSRRKKTPNMSQKRTLNNAIVDDKLVSSISLYPALFF